MPAASKWHTLDTLEAVVRVGHAVWELDAAQEAYDYGQATAAEVVVACDEAQQAAMALRRLADQEVTHANAVRDAIKEKEREKRRSPDRPKEV